MTLSQDILKKMLELPHREAGTVYEQKAGEYLKSVYKYFGVETKEFDSTTIKDSFENHLIITFILIIATVLVNFINVIFITLPLFIITIAVYLRLFNLPFRFVKKTSKSQNIYADIPATKQQRYTLVITSHYDTGKNLSPIVSLLGPVYKFLINSPGTLPEYFNNPMVIPNLALGLTALALFIPDNYAKFFFGLFVAIPLIIAIVLLNNSKKKFPSGAFDNGVGTALLVELAANLSKNPLDNVRLIFANVAAEETLTKGTLPFIKSLNLDRSSTFILNLDCIGEEQLVLFKEEPSYPLGLNVPFDSSFQVIADFVEDYFQSGYRIERSPLATSNQDLVFAGYRVMGTISTMPINGYPKNFHSTSDTVEKIKWDSVETMRDFLGAYFKYFDELSKVVQL